MNEPRIVLDTNVLVSGLCFGGTPARILSAALAGKVKLFTTADLIDELKRVLQTKFPHRQEAIADTVEELGQIWEVLPRADLPRIRKISADPSDDRVLECAVAARADCIVSGDNHLLALESFAEVPILNPTGFLRRFRV